ncbi:MAG: STAS domain-containing protein [Phycisphaerae bacterium]
MAEEQSHLTITESAGVKIVEFADRQILDEIAITEIGNELYSLVDGTPGVKILACFRNVEHLSSAAIGVLITLKKKVAEQKGALKLSDITPQIYEVFRITRLNKHFEIYDTAGQALASF